MLLACCSNDARVIGKGDLPDLDTAKMVTLRAAGLQVFAHDAWWPDVLAYFRVVLLDF